MFKIGVNNIEVSVLPSVFNFKSNRKFYFD